MCVSLPLVQRLGLLLLAVVSIVLAGCSSAETVDQESFEFNSCSEAECSGKLESGAEFEILMPESWTGTLVLFSPGIQMPELGDKKNQGGLTPAAPDRNSSSAGASDGGPQPAPGWGDKDANTADVMLQAGYAIAGASTGRFGWNVRSQIVAAEELYKYFADNIANPGRVYAWGESTGGLASARLAELHPEWVDGASAICAPMSGPVPSFELALDAGFAIRQLLVPNLQLVNFSTYEEALDSFKVGRKAVRKSADDGEAGQARILFIASLLGLPLKTSEETGSTLDSQVSSAVIGIENLLEQSTAQRYLFEQLVGGNPSTNEGTDYEGRIKDERRVQLEAVSSGSVRKNYQELKGPRVVADEDATVAAAAQGELVGDLKVPLLTLHNIFDPVYIVQNESWYRDRVGTFGPEIRANLVGAYSIPRNYYNADEPARTGAGHCHFEVRTVVGLLIQLDLWIRKGDYPGRDSAARAFESQQVGLEYTPDPWPTMAITPQDPPIEPDPDEVYTPPPADDLGPSAEPSSREKTPTQRSQGSASPESD